MLCEINTRISIRRTGMITVGVFPKLYESANMVMHADE